MTKNSIFKDRDYYKPFDYPWAFEAYLMQRRMHWIPEEVSLAKDVNDWNNLLSESEKNLVTQIFRFFTNGDVVVAKGYYEKYIPQFPKPEVRMMLGAFANMESTHIHAYSLLLDTIGMPEVEYKAFHEFAAMQAKHEYYMQAHPNHTKLQKMLLDLAIFSAFGEGMQLFSSFAILLNFPRHNLLEKMGRIITWSIRDEELHCSSMIQLFHTILDENPKLWTEEMKSEIYQICRDMVDLEDKFIDLAFEMGNLEDLTSEQVKEYIRFIADKRLLQLGLKPNFGVKKNPLKWIEDLVNTDEFVNFFETEVTEYSQGMLTGDWEGIEKNNLFDDQSIYRFMAKR